MKLFAAVLVAAMVGCSTPHSIETEVKLDSTLHDCTDALDNQSEAIKNLEHALDVVEKQRDEFMKDMRSNVLTIKNQQAIIEMLQSEYTREHSVPINGGATNFKNCCDQAVCICDN